MSRRSPLTQSGDALGRGISALMGNVAQGHLAQQQALAQGMGALAQGAQAGVGMGLQRNDQMKSDARSAEAEAFRRSEMARLEQKQDELLRQDRMRKTASAEAQLLDQNALDEGPPPSGMQRSQRLADQLGERHQGLDILDRDAIAASTVTSAEASAAERARQLADLQSTRDNKLFQDESKWGRDIAKIYIEDALKRARETGNKPLESQYGEGVKRYHAWQSADQRAAGDAIMSNAAPEFAREMREAEFGKAIAGIAQHPTMAPEVKRDLLRMFAEGARGAGASASSVREEMIQSALGLADQMGGGGGGGGGDGGDASAAPPPREAVRSIADTLRGRGIDLNDDDIERISDIESLVESGDISNDDARSEVELLIRDARQRVPGTASPPTMDVGGMPTSAGVPDAPTGPMVDDPDGGVIDTPGGVADEADALGDVMRQRSEPPPAGDITGYIPGPMREVLMSLAGMPESNATQSTGAPDDEGPPAPPMSKRLAHLFGQEGFRVTSTVRDEKSNATAKGINKSRHLLRNGGDAIDIGVDDNTTNFADRFPELVEKYRAIMSNPKLRPRVRFIQLEMPVEFQGQVNVPPDVKVKFVKGRPPHIHLEGDYDER